MVVVHCPV